MQDRKTGIVEDFDDATEIFAEWKPSERFAGIFGKSVAEALKPLKAKNRINVLEVGCGHGTWLGYLDRMGISKKISYVGIDFSRKRIEAAKKIFKKNKNANFFAADYLEFQDSKKYDIVLFIEVFQYVDKKDFGKFLEKAKIMLGKNGCVVVIDKDKYSVHSLKISLGKFFKKLPHYYRHVRYPSFSCLERLAKVYGLKPVKRLKAKEFSAIILKN
ncbi:class I SAM-dependent methyltransferase [Candidatus Woesearchaeota archaeon]|nr:class I SAM-dependent methyltransferase [Candidatus Woesearchaeota archaeon]